MLNYVKTTKDDLRNRTVERQGCDAYQWALLISTHEQRHILQIREIKADPKFPSISYLLFPTRRFPNVDAAVDCAVVRPAPANERAPRT